LLFLQNPAHRTEAIKMIAEIDEIPAQHRRGRARQHIVKLSKSGEIQTDWMSRALDMGRLIGMTDLAAGRGELHHELQAGADGLSGRGHSGAGCRPEPGIHKHRKVRQREVRGYGFPALPRLKPGSTGMTERT